MIMRNQGERPPAVAWFMERGRRRRRPGVSLSLSPREDPASSFGAPARERKRTRERFFCLCCVVGLLKLVFILLIIILPLRLPSPARPQGTSRNEALPPFFWQTPPRLAPFPPCPAFAGDFFPKHFQVEISRSGHQGEARPAAGGDEKVCRESAGGAVEGVG